MVYMLKILPYPHGYTKWSYGQWHFFPYTLGMFFGARFYSIARTLVVLTSFVAILSFLGLKKAHAAQVDDLGQDDGGMYADQGPTPDQDRVLFVSCGGFF